VTVGADQEPVEVARPEVPGYTLLKELGRGGMGVVYQARDLRLNRLVALKMILAGGHAGPADLARFRAEAEAIARLQHAHIVQVFEVGECGGLPFFSLEFCSGGSLDKKLNGTPLPPQEAAALVELLARAMQAAHAKGVVHRDLKPGNVLLAEDGTPKITDFGLAKKLDEAGRTATGAVLGTPSYMAPEQAGGDGKRIGPAADVYALGAILYETLTGRPPFRAATPLDTILQVVSAEPVPPRQLQPSLPRDLETICLKCLSKEPRKRYSAAADLADDLHRFLAGEPIRARPVGPVERSWRWCRRNPLAVAVALALLAGTAVSTWFAIDAGQERGRAEVNARRAEQRRYVSDMHLAQRAWQDGDTDRLRDLLDGLRPAQTGGAELRGFEWHYLWRLAHADRFTFTAPTDGSRFNFCFRRDGTPLVALSKDGRLRLRDLAADKDLLTMDGVSSPLLSPDGTRLISARPDGTVAVWDLTAGKQLCKLPGLTGRSSLVFSADGKRLATVQGEKDGPHEIGLWDTASGELLWSVALGTLAQHPRLSLTANGDRVATVCMHDFPKSVLQVWDGAAGKPLFELDGPDYRIPPIALSPDGALLATATERGTALRLCDGATGKETRLLEDHTDGITDLAFRHDGKQLVACGSDATVRIWDPATGKELIAFHGKKFHRVEFSPNGQQLVGREGNKLAIWAAAPLEWRPAEGKVSSAGPVVFSPDGTRVAMPDWSEAIKVWDAATMRLFASYPVSNPRAVAFTPDGRQLVCGGNRAAKAGAAPLAGWVSVLEAASGKEVISFQAHERQLSALALSPDGRLVATGSGWYGEEERKSHGGELCLWEIATRRKLFMVQAADIPVARLAFSPDGQRLAVALGQEHHIGPGEKILLLDVTTGSQALVLAGHAGGTFDVAFSPDGRQLASSGGQGQAPGEVKVCDITTGNCVLTLRGHKDAVRAVGFTPDGQRLASSGSWQDATVRLWDLATGQEVLSLPVLGERVTSVAFAPDGRRLVAAAHGLRLWESRPVTEDPPPRER
jgi:WD40 repeat protein